MDSVPLGSTEEPYVPDMTHSYRLTEGRLIHYPLIRLLINYTCYDFFTLQVDLLWPFIPQFPHLQQIYTYSDLNKG